MPLTEAGTPTWLSEDDCDLDAFRSLVEERTESRAYPSAERTEQNVLVYAGDRIRRLALTPQGRREVQAELVRALLDGPGVVVLKGAFTDPAVVDAASGAFDALIEEERSTGTARGDHFAKPGANDRVWSGLDKVAVRAPEVFADYYANDLLALVSEAWLGPAYQVTSQINVVNPGGAAQSAHRDYHLGFLSQERAAAYPAHVHRLSPVLTLQGAVAHCDMPVESGPTLYLPHSQKYEPGYLAWRRPEFVAYFKEHHVQLPLAKGDAVFFNPALFHAAGHNRSADIKRMANLLQVPPRSAAPWRPWTGRPWRAPSSRSCCAARRRAPLRAGCAAWSPPRPRATPSPPTWTSTRRSTVSPPSQADTLWQAVAKGWAPARLREELQAGAKRRRS